MAGLIQPDTQVQNGSLDAGPPPGPSKSMPNGDGRDSHPVPPAMTSPPARALSGLQMIIQGIQLLGSVLPQAVIKLAPDAEEAQSLVPQLLGQLMQGGTGYSGMLGMMANSMGGGQGGPQAGPPGAPPPGGLPLPPPPGGMPQPGGVAQ